MKTMTRRGALLSLGAAAASVAIPAGPARAQTPATRQWTGNTTQNGWPVIRGAVTAHDIEGSLGAAAIPPGEPTTILNYVLRRFNYEIHPLKDGDVVSHTRNRTITAPYESNHLSGTAVAILPNVYPLGVSGGYFPLELVVIRDILAQCQGVVRWGGDDPDFPKEGHFQIDVPPNSPQLRSVAETFTAWQTVPDKGPGAVGDPFDASRREQAQALEGRQRRP